LRVYLDSCVVIYAVERPGDQGAVVARELETLDGESQTCISDLVWLECMVDPVRVNDQERQQAMLEGLAGSQVLSLDSNVFRLATELRAAHGLKTPDALHVACAITHGCDEFWTNDDRLAGLSEHVKTRLIR
jgi:uncharacterized protein